MSRNNLPKSNPEELGVVEAFTEHMLYCFSTTTSLAVRVIPHLGFECFIACPYCSVENLKGCFSCFGYKSWEA
jgi:uncharacterized membrane protein YagU involved in acid resistance